MDDLKLPTGHIPQGRPRNLSMDDYLAFVLMCHKAFPPKGPDQTMPAPVRFVIRDTDETWPAKDPQK